MPWMGDDCVCLESVNIECVGGDENDHGGSGVHGDGGDGAVVDAADEGGGTS